MSLHAPSPDTHPDPEPVRETITHGDIRVAVGVAALTYTESEYDFFADSKSFRASAAPAGLLQIGFAATELAEVGVLFRLSYSTVKVNGEANDVTNYSLIPYVSLNFPMNDSGSVVLSPVLGLGYEGFHGDQFDGNSFLLELGGECKFFVANNASIDLGLFFDYEVGKIGGGNFDQWSIGPRVKISIWP